METDCTGQKVGRTQETENAYRERYEALCRAVEQVSVDVRVQDVILWFCTQNDRWSASTIHQYRAAIIAQVERAIVDADRREALIAQLRDHSPVPKVGGPRRTSARKRKSVARAEVAQVAKFLQTSGRVHDPLIARLVLYGVRSS